MVNEFRGISKLTGSNFQTGEDILVFYEIEDVDRGNDMIVLAGYCLFIHVLSCAVLTLRYKMHGTIIPISEKEEKVIRLTHEGVSETFPPLDEEQDPMVEEEDPEVDEMIEEAM